jgi:sugar/nucleoside kinase (ribokinase family)
LSRGAFDYVTVGHVTVDVVLDSADDDPCRGVRQAGGGAFYSALQAARLGLRTLICTRGVPEELGELLAPHADELAVQIEPAPQTTTLLTRGRGVERVQRVLAWAGPLEAPANLDAEILHLAPVARETPAAWSGRARFVGLTPQGLVRAWNAAGEIVPAELARELVPARCDAIVFSTHERERCAELASAGGKPVVAITAGAGATRVLRAGADALEVEACAVPLPHDDLGAGDVFAAAFFAALHEGMDAARAAAFGNAAAAVRIAGAGAQAIGDRDAIERRLLSSGEG